MVVVNAAGSDYGSSSDGHPGFARGAMFAANERSYIVLRSAAELHGNSIRERTHPLIASARPKLRDELARQGREMGYP